MHLKFVAATVKHRRLQENGHAMVVRKLKSVNLTDSGRQVPTGRENYHLIPSRSGAEPIAIFLISCMERGHGDMALSRWNWHTGAAMLQAICVRDSPDVSNVHTHFLIVL